MCGIVRTFSFSKINKEPILSLPRAPFSGLFCNHAYYFHAPGTQATNKPKRVTLAGRFRRPVYKVLVVYSENMLYHKSVLISIIYAERKEGKKD